jgi:energy-coupling factor transport system ATP-binding protein
MDGTPREIFSMVKQMKKLGLGVPQVTNLAHELKLNGFPIYETILTVEEFLNNSTIKGLNP